MLTYKPSQEATIERDVMFDEAVKLIQETGVASASLIQRRLKLGYARSARLLDELEQSGIIGEVNGAKPRDILIPHKNREGQTIIPKKEPSPVKIEFEETLASWKKTKHADNVSENFKIELGIDENKKEVDLNLEKYGNLLIIGSQFTSTVDLLNNILTTSMAKYSPNELKLIVIDGVKGDLIVPNQASHLLTPMIVEAEKSVSALKWCVNEIERRMKLDNLNPQAKVLILINSLNQILNFSPSEIEDNIYRIMVQGRKYGFYFIISTDYANPRTAKSIIANSPAKLVFKPTDKKIARESGIPEAIELSSPDEAILETMYEGKRKLTINKVDPKKIYREIFE
ncbi:MAG: segregation ATPase, FtsK/SpoIIIE family protein [Candidatus Shapirobacteria bacterium GW2011_GWE1_38_10]|uniref:Segregation ATPase, FtsK/SpoIIIE family protein n=1 Tax=Candidatus Shapirobacteria bacterium GW2011_GWE1_38_10 TaxID=1618488 RepID=A0A0G0I4M3_9BACT|nr:MAG: segregation ATPase, FtsK/SpoIIIE family protein [Candidatus Shapirobacteria bacterium GW2011_GWF2_37_20]KKQ50263.1 MAG: segregation ATPase, FtsK/SpoIIIE family protein [Candidatus Shapirobacteria bacterium GW2011_GWE1_38_10]KKQ64797.1 MAG: segregation ATPase, FtsK/SpoIIIE family protein [Candidatus Shapirobacteria bacterium GW2011_GWF1_38_23]